MRNSAAHFHRFARLDKDSKSVLSIGDVAGECKRYECGVQNERVMVVSWREEKTR